MAAALQIQAGRDLAKQKRDEKNGKWSRPFGKTGTRRTPGKKRFRPFVGKPWQRDRFSSQAAYDLHHWGEGRCRHYAKVPGHPCAQRGLDALVEGAKGGAK